MFMLLKLHFFGSVDSNTSIHHFTSSLTLSLGQNWGSDVVDGVNGMSPSDLHVWLQVYQIPWVVPPPRISVANGGLGWDPQLKIEQILVVTGILGRGTTQQIPLFLFTKGLLIPCSTVCAEWEIEVTQNWNGKAGPESRSCSSSTRY